MRTAKTLIRLGAQPHCWFCHEAAQFNVNIAKFCTFVHVLQSCDSSRAARSSFILYFLKEIDSVGIKSC